MSGCLLLVQDDTCSGAGIGVLGRRAPASTALRRQLSRVVARKGISQALQECSLAGGLSLLLQ